MLLKYCINIFVIDYDRPLPLVPPRPKRPHGEVEPSTASEAEEVEDPEVDGGDANASGTDTERKRRKAEQHSTDNIPRLVCVLFFIFWSPYLFSLASYRVVI